MINPNDITTVRVGELPLSGLSSTDRFPFETSDHFLKQNTIQALLDYISVRVSSIQFQVVDLWVTQEYINDNLEVNGLGKNLLLGYALCDGRNGTPNMSGLVSIGYGTSYPNIGGFGGSKDQVVIEHSHGGGTYNSGSGPAIFTQKGLVNGSDTVFSRTVSEGVSGIDKNMQPYIILLKVMKL